MVTKAQALTANNFHYEHPTAKCKAKVYNCRRNGKTKTWKTRPNEFKVPIKYGLYTCGYITHDNAHNFHVADECPYNA